MPAAASNCRSPNSSSSSSRPPFSCISLLPDNEILNMSPRLSSFPNSNAKLLNRLSCEASLNRNWETTESIPSNGTPTLKSSDAVRKEIATLEAEILNLERYLLSLYRVAFEEHLPPSSNVPKNHLEYKKGSPSKVIVNQQHAERNSFAYNDQNSPAHDWPSADDRSCSSCLHSTSSSTRDQKKTNSGRRSLADHLGPSCLVDSPSPDRLSEEILRCISSIYCRLANPPNSNGVLPSSPPSSLSSSSVFSSRNPCDNWSPQYSEDTMPHSKCLKEEGGGPYAGMVEVMKIYLDDDSFNYAAVMLKNFRSLVQGLEKVDPRKMKREEKIAFWINIHNALVMHAYLAYGTHNRVKGTSILKATYNIGGECINACVIQNSIFRIRSHYSEPWLQTLFSPGRKSKSGSCSHAYALEYAEPLVHFALCSGAYSDPAVRVYTAKNIFQELKVAKTEFIQASVYMHKQTKIFLPKILCYFAKDMSMDVSGLLEAINGCLTEVQQKAVRKCMKKKLDKYIHWLPQSSSFLYVIHEELAKGR